MTDDKLREAQTVVEELLRSSFPKTDFTSIRIRPDVGHYGDEIVWVEAFYRGSDAELYSETGLGIITEIWRRLRAAGITAFPIERFLDVDEEPYGAAS